MKNLDAEGVLQQFVVSASWEHYRYLLNMLEEYLDEDLQFLDEGQEDAIRTSRKSDGGELSTWSRDYFRFMPRYRPALMNSLFCAFFALFESQLTWLCDVARRRHRSPFSVHDFRSSSINRFKTYLKKLGIQSPGDSPQWSEIKHHQQIRNKILHAGAAVTSEWDHLAYAKKEGILDEDTSQLALTRPFCEKTLTDFKQLTLRVSQSVIDDAKSNAK